MNANELLQTVQAEGSATWTEQPGNVTFTARYSRWKLDSLVIKARVPSRKDGSNETFEGTGMWQHFSGDAGLMQATTKAVHEAITMRAHVERTHFDVETQEWF